MARIVIELTNRCNLSCQHCFSGRHGGRDDLPLGILQDVLDQAKAWGFDEITFTGGDPTVYAHFPDALRLTYEAGYQFGFVTNGQNFPTTFQHLLPYLDRLTVVTFSLDGATQETHDQIRGKGSFHKVLAAMSVCVAKGIPFTNNMVVTAHNRHEIELMATLATNLGSQGLRYGHLMHTRSTTSRDWDLSPRQRKATEARIWALRSDYPIPIAIAPGYHTTDLFPCAVLNLQETNIDCHGNLTTCCHLSSHGDGAGQGDVMADLAQVGFDTAYRRLVEENQQFRRMKLAHVASDTFADEDYFPCWYCSLHYRKVDWLTDSKDHAWTKHMWQPSHAAQSPIPIAFEEIM